MQGRRNAIIALAATFCIIVASATQSGGAAAGAPRATPIQVYGAWHCGAGACLWGSVRDMSEFDRKNHWLIDRGDGRPSVNLVVLSFVHPLRALNGTTDAITSNGVPRGMTEAVVDYFTSHGA